MLLNFIDNTYDSKKLAQYKLSVQINLNGLTFCVFDTVLGKHVLLRNYQYKHSIVSYEDLGNEITTIIANDRQLAANYPACSCIYICDKHTLIPAEVFAEDKLYAYLKFMSPVDELDEIHYQRIPQTDIYSIYTLPSPVASILSSTYKQVRFFNQSYPIILSILKNTEEGGDKLYINLHEGIADMALMADKEFKLHNTFKIYHLNDLLYYISALLQSFKQQALTTAIFVSGDILKDEIDELVRYLPLLRVNSYKPSLPWIGYENSYRYYNLLTIHECEL